VVFARTSKLWLGTIERNLIYEIVKSKDFGTRRDRHGSCLGFGS
jgi:hypothetical protein